MTAQDKRRIEEENAFALWTVMTLWAVVGSYLLTSLFMILVAHFR